MSTTNCCIKCRADPPYTQNTQAAQGPWNTRGTPCSQRGFHLVSFLKLASGYENMNDQLFECDALSPSLCKMSVKSCNVNIVQSLETRKKNEPRKRYSFSSTFRERVLRWSETRTNAFQPFFHPILSSRKNSLPTVHKKIWMKFLWSILICLDGELVRFC